MKFKSVLDMYPGKEFSIIMVLADWDLDSSSARVDSWSEHLRRHTMLSLMFSDIETSWSAFMTVCASKQVEDPLEKPATTPMLSVPI